MSDNSAIEWTDATWNPVTGCTKVSPGCDNCYALTFSERWRGTPGHYFKNGFDVQLRPDKLTTPFAWKKPRRVFVNSMSDLFHKDVPDAYIAKVFAVMAATPQHTYQVLTKRHGRMRALLNDECNCGNGHVPGVHFRSAMAWAVSKANPDRIPGVSDDAEKRVWNAPWPLPNVWLGVSVEDQKRADIRIPALLGTPAAVRFLSCEPLLGPVELYDYLVELRDVTDDHADAPDGAVVEGMRRSGDQWHRIERLNWVIVGGESGRGARPMSPQWATQIIEQCQSSDVAVFVKQLGSRWAKNHKDIDTFPAALQIREYPQAVAAMQDGPR
ncbi:DUF5131 family protein [Streptomyces yunnanensis]|uniref:Protein gp37 n=1 Tax=Streptomyces yunnanensis TaxID=156453 RepID=A0A9X8QS76_9ACTN|nr:phage Gp37/Gp68 family protein [Streptomyces yunnanensis]SHL73422.1 protein gp37 [Streptomyces yunnanensis]